MSQSAAKLFFPGENPLGRFVTQGDVKYVAKYGCRVIGVAENARMQSLLKPAELEVYLLYAQSKKPFVLPFMAVRGSDALAAEAIRNEVARNLRGATASRIYTFDQAVNDDLSRQRLLSSVSGGFALLALTLVGAGLFGVLSRSVTDRRREIGVRMALGAQRKRIVASLARGAALRVCIGAVAGAGLALAVGHLLQSMLYGVSAASPLVGFCTLGLLLAVLVTAFVVPAARAASIEPMETIREE